MTRRRIAALGALAAAIAAAAVGASLRPPPLESGAYVTCVTSDAATLLCVHEGRTLSRRVQGLAPGPKGLAAPGGASVRFRTARPAGEGFAFVAIGDSGVTREREGAPDRTAIQYALAVRMLAAAPDFVLHTGDVAYYHSERWKYGYQFFEPFADLLARTVLFATPGNHDTRHGLASAYFELFPSGGPDPRFYSFDWGSVHFVSLDGSDDAIPDDHPQAAWLERDLASVPAARGIVVFQHFPIYSSAWRSPEVHAARRLLPVLTRYRVGLFLAGHHHFYERTEPIEGTTYVVTGGGGAELHEIGRRERWSAAAAKRFHFVTLAVAPTGESVAIEAVSPEGEVFDRATVGLGRGR